MKGFITLSLLVLADISLASPLGKNIKGVTQKREAQDQVIDIPIELGLDLGLDVEPREVLPVRLRFRINLGEQQTY